MNAESIRMAVPIRPKCPRCNNAGYFMTDKGAAECDCEKEKFIQLAMEKAGLPAKLSGKKIIDFHPRDACQEAAIAEGLALLNSFTAEKSHDGFLMWGTEGNGKSLIAALILRQAIIKGHSGRFENVAELYLQLRGSMFDPDTEEKEYKIITKLFRVDLLVLDDICATKPTDYAADTIYVILNHRLQHGKSTIVTTNKKSSEIAAAIGPRIASRLRLLKQVQLSDTDYRGTIE